MKANLSAPKAKLNWANNQIVVLQAAVSQFGESKPYKIVAKPNIGGKGQLLYLESTKSVPQDIAIHLGMILSAQRDSLDFLVTALAEKNGAVEPRDCLFPFADSEHRFLENGTQAKIKRLSTEDQRVIHSFKPYKGGNDLLYAFNWLCQKGKHRKPVMLGGVQTKISIGGNGVVRSIAQWGMKAVDSGAPIAAIDADPGIQLNFTIDVGFREIPDTAPATPIIPTLRKFSNLAGSIIDRFD